MIKTHPWKRIQTNWAYPAWKQRNPEEAKRIEERYEKERNQNASSRRNRKNYQSVDVIHVRGSEVIIEVFE